MSFQHVILFFIWEYFKCFLIVSLQNPVYIVQTAHLHLDAKFSSEKTLENNYKLNLILTFPKVTYVPRE